MTEPERTPRRIERTLRNDEQWDIRGVEVLSIMVKRQADHGGSVRIVATVIDKPSTNG